MSLFGARPEKERALLELLERLDLKESDMEEKFIRGSGRGGQKLNKTSSCVYLKHLPTGLEVKVSRERSQSMNRFLARRLLAEKYQREILGLKTGRDQKNEKVKKQKQRRKRRCQQSEKDDSDL